MAMMQSYSEYCENEISETRKKSSSLREDSWYRSHRDTRKKLVAKKKGMQELENGEHLLHGQTYEMKVSIRLSNT